MRRPPVEQQDQTATLQLSPTSPPSLTPTARHTPSTSCTPGGEEEDKEDVEGEEEEEASTVKVT